MSPQANPRPAPQAPTAPSDLSGVECTIAVTSEDGKTTLGETTRLLNGKTTHKGSDPVKIEAGDRSRIHLTVIYACVNDRDYSMNFDLYRVNAGKVVVGKDYLQSKPGWSGDRILPDDDLPSFSRLHQLFLQPLELGAYRFILKSWRIADRRAIPATLSGEELSAELDKITARVVVRIQVDPPVVPGQT